MNITTTLILMVLSIGVGYIIAYLKYGMDAETTKIPLIVSYQIWQSHVIHEITINMNTKAVFLNEVDVIKEVISESINENAENIKIISIRAEELE